MTKDTTPPETRRDGAQQPVRRDAGFSLTELMVVVFIMALLAGAIFMSVGNVFGEARDARARSDINALTGSLNNFNLDVGRFPTREEGLRALVQRPSSVPENRYALDGYSQRLELDPWGNPYQYDVPGRRSGKSYDLFSYGADGVEGGEGENADIGNWQTDADLEGY